MPAPKGATHRVDHRLCPLSSSWAVPLKSPSPCPSPQVGGWVQVVASDINMTLINYMFGSVPNNSYGVSP